MTMIVYLLMADFEDTTFSHCSPIGIAVTDEDKAKDWVENSDVGYYRSYEKVAIVDEIVTD